MEKISDKQIKITLTKKKISFMILSAVAMALVSFFFREHWVFSIQSFLLYGLLAYISLIDDELHLCPDWAHLAIIGLSLIGIGYAFIIKDVLFLIQSGLGFILCPLPILATTVFSKSAPIGGADIKLVAVLGLTLGMTRGYIALIIALLLGVIVNFILVKKGKRTKEDAFAFIPYLAFGAMIANFL